MSENFTDPPRYHPVFVNRSPISSKTDPPSFIKKILSLSLYYMGIFVIFIIYRSKDI